MHNWSCDIKKLKRLSKKGARLFVLEQKINFGLAGSKLSKRELIHLWPHLKIDPDRRRFLAFLLWNRKS